MFTKILIANRGDNTLATGVASHRMARTACAGEFAAETQDV